MASKQSVLDKWFLRQDIINQLLESGEESEDALKFVQEILGYFLISGINITAKEVPKT